MANGILNFDPDEVDQDVIDFYGGDAQQIAQPDASYFSEFALPSTREPVEASDSMPVMSQSSGAGLTLADIMGGQPAFFNRTDIPAQIQRALAAQSRQLTGGQPSQREMAATSTPIDRTLQNRILELQTLNEGRMPPNMGFMGMRF